MPAVPVVPAPASEADMLFDGRVVLCVWRAVTRALGIELPGHESVTMRVVRTCAFRISNPYLGKTHMYTATCTGHHGNPRTHGFPCMLHIMYCAHNNSVLRDSHIRCELDIVSNTPSTETAICLSTCGSSQAFKNCSPSPSQRTFAVQRGG